jgi:hypothetical protein
MPFTFFAHQVFVLPLKWARPRWFDGTALCVGSMAPDLAYSLFGTPLAFPSHRVAAQVFWTLPVTLLLVRSIRDSIAEPVGARLPAPLGPELRALAWSRHSLRTTSLSALIGGLSHVFVDGFTHFDGWAARRIEFLQSVAFEVGRHGVSVARVLQYVSHIFGTALGVAMFAWLISRRRFSAWSGAAPAAAPVSNTPRFWVPLLIGCVLALPAALSVAATGGGLSVAIIRAAWAVFAGLALCGRFATLDGAPAQSARS